MKYKNPISFLILFLLLSVTCFSQSIVPRANSSYTVMDSRGMWQYNAFIPRYEDSVAANLQKGIDTCGAVVYLYATHTLWYRSCAGGAKAWVDIGSGGGGNLIVQRAGSGIQTWYTSGDTLYLEDIEGSTYIDVTKAADSTVNVALNTTALAARTETLTNKRWTARVGSTTSSATPAINTDNVDIYKLTAQAEAITSMSSSLSGTPVDGDILEIQITGTDARAITWGASFVSSTVTLPATTVTTATLTVILQYYTTSSYGNNKWVCVNYY